MSRKWWIIIIGGIVTLIGCGVCAFSGVFAAILGSDTTVATGSGNNDPAQVYQLNQNVIVGKVRWKVLVVENLGAELKSDNQFIDSLGTTGRFVLVRVEVENQAAEARTFIEGDLEDDQGRTFGDNSDAIFFVEDNERCILESLNPNLPRICTAIYEVPADATGLKLVVGDLAPFGGEASINLGLR